MGAGATVNFASNIYQVGTLDQNCTVSVVIPTGAYECYLELVQGGLGSNTVTWDALIDWSADLPPILSTTVGARDIIKFIFNGTRLRGYVPGMDFR